MEYRAEKSVWNIAIFAIVIFVGITLISGIVTGAEITAVASR